MSGFAPPTRKPRESARQKDEKSQTRLPVVKRHKATLPSSGAPLPRGLRSAFEQRLGADFGPVRVETGAVCSSRPGARAETLGNHISFASERHPFDIAERRTLAHELAHVVQFRNDATGGDVTAEAELEREADAAADAWVNGYAAPPIRGVAGTIPLFDANANRRDDDSIAGWLDSRGSVLLLIDSDRRVYMLPAQGIAVIPPDVSVDQIRKAPPHVSTDLGALLEAPAVGAGATRVFRAGPRLALMLDAGSDPGRGVGAALYLTQLQAAMGRIGISGLQRVQLIHVHRDHISQIPQVVQAFRVAPANLVIPQPFLSVPEMQRVIGELRSNQQTVALGYGPNWVPGTVVVKDRSPQSALYRSSYRVGELVVEQIALRSAIANVSRNPDLASYLTFVTRPSDRAKVAVLGDLRGADLATIRTAMERERPGSWAELFEGVTILSGFSHHAGAMKDADVAGMMQLLDVTLLREGKLKVAEQTNPDIHREARADTRELAARLGIQMTTANMPTAGTAPSSVGASKQAVQATGPETSTQQPIGSALTVALGRIQRLVEARETVVIWRPYFEEMDPDAKRFFDAELLPEIERSLATLRAAARAAAEAAMRVRTGGQRTTGGTTRDYSAAGGPRGAGFAAALGNIPTVTPAETRLGPSGFDALSAFRRQNIEEIPLRVALHAALVRGVYSDQAFTAMLKALDPATRNSLLTGPRGGPSPKLKAFERVRAQFGFQQSVLSGSDIPQIPRGASPGMQGATRAVGGLLALLELWNSVGLPITQAIQTGRRNFAGRNLVPFVRRLLFWQQMGIAPRLVGVEDPNFGAPREETNYATVIEGLNAQKWDALYIAEPGLTDNDAIRLGVWISYNIRNFDEFALLFIDSQQDAVSYDTPTDGWAKATWKVRVGRYATQGENHVQERWYEHPRLTQLMQIYVGRLIENTQRLLDEIGRKGRLSQDSMDRYGTLSLNQKPKGRVHLRGHAQSLPDKPTRVGVETQGEHPSRLTREVTWWSPPQFFIYEESGDYALVGGADYNTFANLRRLTTEKRTLYMTNTGNYTGAEQIGNEGGRVWIHISLLEGDDYPLRRVAPPGALGPLPSASTPAEDR